MFCVVFQLDFFFFFFEKSKSKLKIFCCVVVVIVVISFSKIWPNQLLGNVINCFEELRFSNFGLPYSHRIRTIVNTSVILLGVNGP